MILPIALCLLVSGCGAASVIRSMDTPSSGNTPLARAYDNGNAKLLVITCGVVAQQADELVKILEALDNLAPIVAAHGAASASVTINVCGSDPIVVVPVVKGLAAKRTGTVK